MIKRTELEILDKAIDLAQRMQAAKDALKLSQERLMSCAIQEECKCKNMNLEGIRKMYEVRLANERSELKAEMEKKVAETKLADDVIALQDNIELLRWLYKEDMKGE